MPLRRRLERIIRERGAVPRSTIFYLLCTWSGCSARSVCSCIHLNVPCKRRICCFFHSLRSIVSAPRKVHQTRLLVRYRPPSRERGVEVMIERLRLPYIFSCRLVQALIRIRISESEVQYYLYNRMKFHHERTSEHLHEAIYPFLVARSSAIEQVVREKWLKIVHGCSPWWVRSR